LLRVGRRRGGCNVLTVDGDGDRAGFILIWLAERPGDGRSRQ
jgi:hypothetical protein